jgi:hypothetical protein
MTKYTHKQIDEMSARECRDALKKLMADEDDDRDDEDEDGDKDDDKKGATAMKAIAQLLARGQSVGAYLTDCSNVEGERLIVSFKQTRTPFVACWWGAQARFISVARNSSIGEAFAREQLTFERFVDLMLSGDDLDELLVCRPGKRDLTLKGPALEALAGASIQGAKHAGSFS